MLRPSSARRLGNMRALVAEFAARDIGCAGVALFLPCSLTTARNYIAELLDAGLLTVLPARQGESGLDRTLYRCSADPLALHRFHSALAVSREAAETAASATRPDAGRIHRTWRAAGFSLGAGQAPARRDPLVAALFGAA